MQTDEMHAVDVAASMENWKTRFFVMWGGQAFSLLGSSLVHFALIWWLTEKTASATVLAMATLIGTLPQIVVGPFAGALVDRWNRRVVMMVSDSMIALATLGLMIINWQGAMQPWHIYAILLIRSLGGTFQWPAMQASTSLMVPKSQLSRVAGMNQTLNGIMSIIAPPFGAFLIALIPLYGVLAIDVSTALLAVGPLFFIHVPQPARKASSDAVQTGPATTLWQDVRDVFRYMWNWKGIFIVCVMATVINLLLNPAFSLLPILVTQHFGGDALQLGWINSAWGVGVVAGGLILSAWGGFKRRIVTTIVGLLGIGLGTLIIGLTPGTAFGLGVAGMFVAGLMNPITNGPLFAVLQDVVEPGMQGRVFNVLGSMSVAMSPLGLAIAGPLADTWGAQAWFIIGGVGCIAMAIFAFFVPDVIHLEDEKKVPKEAVSDAAPAPSVQVDIVPE